MTDPVDDPSGGEPAADRSDASGPVAPAEGRDRDEPGEHDGPVAPEYRRGEKRLLIMVALISALAALAGAAVGGFASYLSSKNQTQSAAAVEQMQEQAKGDQAVRDERMKAYVDLLSAIDALEKDEFDIGHQFEAGIFSNQTAQNHAALDERMGQHATLQQQSFHAENVVGLVGSYGAVQDAMAGVSSIHVEILRMIDDFANAVILGTLDAELAKNKCAFDSKVDAAKDLADKFRDIARADLDVLSATPNAAMTLVNPTASAAPSAPPTSTQHGCQGR